MGMANTDAKIQVSGRMSTVAVLLPIMLLVVFQGGFFATPTCVLGVIICVIAGAHFLRKGARSAHVSVFPLLLCGMALSYLISASVNGMSITTVSTAGAIASCAGYACLVHGQGTETYERAMTVISWFGVITAVGGVLVSAGIWPMVGGMVDARLQFSFQYANAAAAWYGACALLCLLSPDERLNVCAALPGAGLLLTLSGGGLLLFGTLVLCGIIVLVRTERWDKLFRALLQAILASAIAVVTYAWGGIWSILALAAVACACVWLFKNDAGSVAPLGPRMTSIALLVALALGAVIAIVLLPQRMAEALASITERGYHIRDGLRLWSTTPVFGVGPNNWQYLYQYIQTAPYHTTVVHSSLVQFLLDAGLLGFVCFVVAMAFGVRWAWRTARAKRWRGWVAASLVAALFLLVYATIEFDLQFSALLFMLSLLVCPRLELRAPDSSASSDPNAPAAARQLPRLKGVVLGILSLLLVPVCVAGVLCGLTSTAMTTALAEGDYDVCESLFQSNAFAQADTLMQGQYLTAQYERGNYGYALSTFERMAAPSDADTIFAAMACYRQGDMARATTIMADRLEAQPYNSGFCASARQLVNTYGYDEAQGGRLEVAMQTVESNTLGFEEAS